MTVQGDDRSREKAGGESDILNYASPGTAKTRRKVPISGVVSLVAVLAQMPWWHETRNFVGLMYDDQGPPGVRYPPTSDWIIFIVWLGVFLPMVVGLACGCYSVKVAGISWRNKFGVLGLILVAALGIWVVVGVCLAVFGGFATLREVVLGRFFPILILPLVMILIVVWRLATSRWRPQRPQ